MARRKRRPRRSIESYQHPDHERLNNPPVGLVTPETDPDGQARTYAYDPHLDPQLVWAGKAEHTSFEVPTVSLHVHERIDPCTIVEAARKQDEPQPVQLSLFALADENPPIRQAIEFYRHKHGWSNRLIAGDSLLVMNSLLQKEGLAGQVQMIYIDPPYGIKYGSNFQPFVNKRDVKDGKDEDLTAEPEQIRAFRDTWELGIHSYLTYLRDRLLLARELLHESGSVFLQISDENLHHVRELMDEVFGAGNCISIISFLKTSGKASALLDTVNDFLVWYAKSKDTVKVRSLYVPRSKTSLDNAYNCVELPDGSWRRLTKAELAGADPLPQGKRFMTSSLFSASGGETTRFSATVDGQQYTPTKPWFWKTNLNGMTHLEQAGRLVGVNYTLTYKRYAEDFPFRTLNSFWDDTIVSTFASEKLYVVQTAVRVIQRCLQLTTDPGDLVLDPTCGSGTTAVVAEQWGRRWITCDTSRVALTLARSRLMTAVYDYYELAHPDEGVSSGFRYRTVPHITLKSIANNEPPGEETLYDQPYVDRKRTRVSGPFTVEAVPAPGVRSPDELLAEAQALATEADTSVARSGETLRQAEWRDELLRTGIRGKAGQHIRFSRLEPLPGCRWLHADGETRRSDEGAPSVRQEGTAYAAQRAAVSFGPEHAPLEQRQVTAALEAQTLVPRPKLLIFAAFQFDPEAARDIDETNWPGVTLLKAQMNADLLTEDLKKKRASNESFWLVGQPDVQVECLTGSEAGMVRVSVHGFDYYNTRTGLIESGGPDKIAVWLLDTDYDGRSLFPRQVFFPMAGDNEGWARLARNLKAEIDPELIEVYRGTVSLPFQPGKHRRIGVKIVDDRGIESMKVVELD
jgi:adenine-specific DNA-methyltransferase